jgi:general secretion pathway protein D
LDKFKSKQGMVTSIQGTSHIIVKDTESTIRDISTFIEKIDRMTPQILVEARIYDITSKESFDIGVDWHVGSNTPITDIARTKTSGRSGTKTNNSTTTDNISTTGTITDVGPTMEVSTTTTTHTVTDDGTGPVTEDKTVTTTTGGGTAGRTADTTTTTGTIGSTATTGLGDSATSSDNTTEATAGTWLRDTYSKSSPFMGGGFDKETGGTLRFGVLNDAVDIEMALSILHKQVGAKLLANPRILVLDNETAKIDIISEIPYQQLNQGQSSGQSFGTTEFKEVGVKLEVTPHLAARDEMIRLKLKPTFSVQTGTVDVGDPSQGVKYPQPVVDKRTADTTLLIKNGQTVVLGGLRKKETTQNVSKVPLLGDLPLFGNLFRSESEDTVNSEIVVFITTWIIKQPVMSQGEQQAYDATEFKGPKTTTTRAEKAEE